MAAVASPYSHCPKCGHRPLPVDQALPAACPACGVILAKVRRPADGAAPDEGRESWLELLTRVPERVDSTMFWGRVLMWAVFALWGLMLIAQNHRTGEMGGSFLHAPLLVFHEAGHVIFRPFGEWMAIAGGTLGQLAMPALLAGALLLKNRDPFGAAIGLWLLGVSLLDVAPYVYDARDPQLVLLSGHTGEAGGHDWIYLLSTLGLLARSQALGGLVRMLGAAVILVALGWAAWLLKQQHGRQAGHVLRED
jgi:hypothetical protein